MSVSTPIQEDESIIEINKGQKRRIQLAMIIISIVKGLIMGALLVAGFDPEKSVIIGIVSVIFWLVLLVLSLFWVEYDARQRYFSLGIPLRVFFILLFLFAIIYYIFRTRGIKGFVFLFKMILFVIMLLLIFTISALLISLIGFLIFGVEM